MAAHSEQPAPKGRQIYVVSNSEALLERLWQDGRVHLAGNNSGLIDFTLMLSPRQMARLNERVMVYCLLIYGPEAKRAQAVEKYSDLLVTAQKKSAHIRCMSRKGDCLAPNQEMVDDFAIFLSADLKRALA